jgi:2-desacetyl-2-hydroxyethyl bacteriochlorophyllide A dehydrogenase
MSTAINRYAILTAPQQLELRTEQLRALEPGEVLVRLRACGLCTMEQRLWTGRQTGYPINPGHEAAGVVVEVHPQGVSSVAVGQRVVIAFLDRCMQCDQCRRGQTQLCTGKFAGRGEGVLRRIGGLADYAIVPAHKLFAMPDTLEFEELALAEPLACVVHGISRAEPQLGDDVLVIGGGVMGQLHLLVCKLRGARVFVSEPDAARCEMAEEHGASKAAAPEELAQHLPKSGVDVVYVTFGNEHTARQAAAAVRPGGRIIYYGSFPADAPTLPGSAAIHQNEIVVDGARGQRIEDWYAATRLLAKRLIDVRHLVTARYPIDQLGAALEHAIAPDSLRILVGE